MVIPFIVLLNGMLTNMYVLKNFNFQGCKYFYKKGFIKSWLAKKKTSLWTWSVNFNSKAEQVRQHVHRLGVLQAFLTGRRKMQAILKGFTLPVDRGTGESESGPVPGRPREVPVPVD